MAMIAAMALSACAAETQNNPVMDVVTWLNAYAAAKRDCPIQYPVGHGQSLSSCSNADQMEQAAINHPRSLTADGIRRSPSLPHNIHKTDIGEARIPAIDVEADCRSAIDIGMDGSLSRCITVERTALNQLAQKWAEFPAADRRQCLRYSTGNGNGTYTDLLTCVEMELRASELHRKTRSIASQ
jgi:hypothetical protein